MKADRWQQIESVYHAALEREAEERRRFLDQACLNDHALGDEVESLLSHELEAAEFLELPGRQLPETVSVACNKTMIGRIRSWFAMKRNRRSGSV